MLRGHTCVSSGASAYLDSSLRMWTHGFLQDHDGENRSVFLLNTQKKPIFTAPSTGSSVFDLVRKAMAQSPFFSRPASHQTADAPKERFLAI